MVSGVTATTLQVTNPNAVVDAAKPILLALLALLLELWKVIPLLLAHHLAQAIKALIGSLERLTIVSGLLILIMLKKNKSWASSSLTFYTYEATIPGDQLGYFWNCIWS